jgi:2-polyprenyl-3-methyl-5-hydroxy-6-metoxy-1,4-benzoquinol methylase
MGIILVLIIAKFFRYQVDLFDKFYADNPEVFSNQYDFITATEVIEHLSEPRFELNRLFTLLKKGGVLAIMTQMITKETDFSTWYYKIQTFCTFFKVCCHWIKYLR